MPVALVAARERRACGLEGRLPKPTRQLLHSSRRAQRLEQRPESGACSRCLGGTVGAQPEPPGGKYGASVGPRRVRALASLAQGAALDSAVVPTISVLY